MFRAIRHLFLYRSILNRHKKDLLDKFNLKIDLVGRLYTIIYIQDYSTVYDSDAPRIVRYQLSQKLREIDEYLMSIGIKELTSVYSMTEIEDRNFLIVIGYKNINTVKLANTGLVIISLLGLIGLFFLIKTILHF